MTSSPRVSSTSSSSLTPASTSVKDGRERVVRNRLRWLAGNWDGKLPSPKSDPAPAGSQSARRRRRLTHGCGERDTQQCESQASASTPPGTRSMAMIQASGGCFSLQQFVEAENAEKVANAKGLTYSTFQEDEEGDSPTSTSNGVGDYFVRSGSDDNGRLVPPCPPPEGLRHDRSPFQEPYPGTQDDIALFQDDDDASSQFNRQDDAYDSAQMLDESTYALLSRGGTTTQGVKRVNRAMSYDENFASKSPPTTTLVGRDDDVGSAPQQQHRFVQVANERTQRQLGGLRAESELVVQRPLQASSGNNNNLNPAVTTKGEKSEHGARYPNRARAPFAEPLSEISVAASGFEFDGHHAPTSETPPSSEIARRDDVATALDWSGEMVSFRKGAQIPHADSSRRDDTINFDEDGDRVRWLLEEVQSLKEELTRAHIQQAAAEATAVSVLQRARAAELSRDVKEIQIRNLEVRLARSDNGDKHYQEACAQRRHVLEYGGCTPKPDVRRGEPLSTVAEEPSSQHGANDPVYTPTTPQYREAGFSTASRDIAGAGAAEAWGRRLRRFEGQFRLGCTAFGEKAARASSGVTAAAALARDTALGGGKETAVARTATARAVEPGRRVPGRNRGDVLDAAPSRLKSNSKATAEEGALGEYWGSDYCTPI